MPLEEEHRRETGTDKIEGGAFAGVMEDKTPFMYKGGEGINAGVGETEWVVSKDRYKYDALFDTLNPIDGKVTGAAAKSEFSPHWNNMRGIFEIFLRMHIVLFKGEAEV